MSKKPNTKEIVSEIAKSLLEKAESEGVTYRQIKEATIKSEHDLHIDTVRRCWGDICRKGNVGEGDKNKLTEIEKGRYKLAKFPEESDKQVNEKQKKNDKIKEEKYYKPFAEYLTREDIQICTKVEVIGSFRSNNQWNNPDVIGMKKFSNKISDRKIITAEIKASKHPNSILTGFGQCCAYKLFSHKVYLVVPKDITTEKRVIKLSAQYNIGLIMFDSSDPIDDVGWEAINHPTFEEPDYDSVDLLRSNKKIKESFEEWEIIG